MNDGPKVLAFLLPQFHTIPENDEWWGKGFTEWTNVRKARPLFRRHRQPRVPAGQNYYDLRDKNAREWQASLAKRHGLAGFCYYHYWFTGRQLLETPVNEVLENGAPDFPFCLAWANEPWTRTWDGSDHEVLMPQAYGDASDWRAHFDYLERAFRDPRYLRHEGCPIFLIYRSASIDPCEPMLALWRQLAKDRGYPGLHVVTMRTIYEDDRRGALFDASMYFEPTHTFNKLVGFARFWERLVNKVNRTIWYRFGGSWCVTRSRSAGAIWRRILGRDYGARVYPGAFVDWDNTARKGAEGWVMRGASPRLFARNFALLFMKARSQGAPYVFINAWNEWAEGTYLEPDTDHGLAYLEAIKRAVGA